MKTTEIQTNYYRSIANFEDGPITAHSMLYGINLDAFTEHYFKLLNEYSYRKSRQRHKFPVCYPMQDAAQSERIARRYRYYRAQYWIATRRLYLSKKRREDRAKLDNARRLWNDAYAEQDTAPSAAIDARTHWAKELRFSAGKVNDDAQLIEKMKAPTRATIDPHSGNVGSLLANIDRFWHCWHIFYELEQTATGNTHTPLVIAALPVISQPPEQNSDNQKMSKEVTFLGGFSIEQADHVAEEIKLTRDKKYALDSKKKSSVVGFCNSLIDNKKISCTIGKGVEFFSSRYEVGLAKDARKGTSKVAKTYKDKTDKALNQSKPVK